MEAKIKLTKTMLNKSIIDANKSVQQFLKEELLHTYDDLEAGEKLKVPSLYEDGTRTTVTFYKAKGRGDKRISVQNLRKFASEGDTLGLREELVLEDDMTFEIRVLIYKIGDAA